jgi:hypothetical protein
MAHKHELAETGSAMVLALVLLVAVALLIVAVTNMSANALVNTSNLARQRSLEYAAESATEAAVQVVRTNYNAVQVYDTTDPNCGPQVAGIFSPMVVDNPPQPPTKVWVSCGGYVSPMSYTRTVDFYACNSGTCTAGNSVLHAQVTFGDFNASNSTPYSCNSSSSATCGTDEIVNAWDVLVADR